MIGVLVHKRSANKPFPFTPCEEVTGKNFRGTADSFSFKHQEKFEEFSLSTLVTHDTSLQCYEKSLKHEIQAKFLHLIILPD